MYKNPVGIDVEFITVQESVNQEETGSSKNSPDLSRSILDGLRQNSCPI